LKEGKRTKDSFLSTSLIAVDVDQKGMDKGLVICVEAMLKRLTDIGLASVLYTTFSYRPEEPCFRILVDLGKDCLQDDHQRSCEWLKQNLLYELCQSGAVDSVSWSPVQPMALPWGYRYQKPIVKLNQGRGLWDLYPKELAQIKIIPPKKTGKREKAQLGLKHHKGRVKQLFDEQIGYLHKKLIPINRAAGAFQFWRSRLDTNPGLYCMRGWRDIYDPSKAKWYSLQYSADDFQEALDHKPTPRPTRVGEIRDWIASDVPYALFNENCGTGKSDALALLSGDSPVDQRYVYTFLTIANRNAFAQKSQNAIIVKSTSEVIGTLLGEERSRPVFEVITNYYSSQTVRRQKIEASSKKTISGVATKLLEKELGQVARGISTTGALRRCLDKGLVTMNELNAVRNEYEKNKSKLQKPSHLLMTTRKFEFLIEYSKEAIFENDVIFTDEHQVGMLTNIDVSQEFEIYGNSWNPKKSDEIDREKLHALKRCIVTSETVASYELNHNRIQFSEIATVQKTPDFETLEVVWVPSTSSNKEKSKEGQSNRKLIKQAVDDAIHADTVVIGNGIGAEYNLVSCKGSNVLREQDTVIMLSLPAPEELAQVMACTGLKKVWEAQSLIMSDKANQAIGRNQGYRNKDEHGNPSGGKNRCLLILTKKNFDIDLHYVTPKVVNAKHWMASNRGLMTSEEKKKNFHFKEVIDQVVQATQKPEKK
jgi:hypothetical protein